MKKVLMILLVAAFLAGCKEKPKNPVAEMGDTMINSYQKGKTAGKAGNLDAVKQAVKAYNAANGKYPETLEEAAAMMGQNIDLSPYNYDPQTGQVSMK